MKYRIWYKDKYTNEIKETVEETTETKDRLLQHAHVVKVEEADKPVEKKEVKAPVKKTKK